jgi:hypothetical protein
MEQRNKCLEELNRTAGEWRSKFDWRHTHLWQGKVQVPEGKFPAGKQASWHISNSSSCQPQKKIAGPHSLCVCVQKTVDAGKKIESTGPKQTLG